MKAVLLCISIQVACGSWCVTAIPQTPKASRAMLNTGRDFFTWELAIKGDDPTLSRVDLVERIPFSILFNFQAKNVLDRKTDTSGWSVVGRTLKAGAAAAPTGTAIAGWATGDPRLQGVAAALGLIQFFISRTQARAPDPISTEEHLFPDEGVILGPKGWDGLVVTGIQTSPVKFGPVCRTEIAGDGFDPSLADYRLARILEARREAGLLYDRELTPAKDTR